MIRYTTDVAFQDLTPLYSDFKPEAQAKVVIGERVRVVFQDLAPDFALPQFTPTDEPPVGRVWSLPA